MPMFAPMTKVCPKRLLKPNGNGKRNNQPLHCYPPTLAEPSVGWSYSAPPSITQHCLHMDYISESVYGRDGHRQLATVLGLKHCLQLTQGIAMHQQGAVPDLQAGEAADLRQLPDKLMPMQVGTMPQEDVPQPPAAAECC